MLSVVWLAVMQIKVSISVTKMNVKFIHLINLLLSDMNELKPAEKQKFIETDAITLQGSKLRPETAMLLVRLQMACELNYKEKFCDVWSLVHYFMTVLLSVQHVST